MQTTSGKESRSEYDYSWIEQASKPILVYDLAGDTYVHANQAAARLFDYPLAQLRNMRPAELTPRKWFEKSGSTYPKEMLEAAFIGGNPIFRWLHRDQSGEEIPCEIALMRLPAVERVLLVVTILDRRQERELSYQAALLSSVSDAVISTDKSFRIRSWNRAAEEMYGWYADEVIGREISHVIRTEYSDTDQATVLEAFKREDFWKGEVVQIRRNGNAINVLASVVALKDAEGKSIGSIAVNRDITDRRRAEEQRRVIEERFSKAFYSHPTAMEIFDLETGNRLEVNNSFCRLFGYEREELLGYSAYEDLIWRGDESNKQLLGDHIGRKGAFRNFPIDLIHKSGKSLSVLASGAKLELGSGNLIILSLIDITREKQAQEQLEAAKQKLTRLNRRFQLSTQAARVGIWEWNVQTDELYWDDLMFALYGMSKDRFSGTSTAWIDCLHPEDVQKCKRAIVLALKDVEPFDVEFRIIWPDQSVRHIKAKASIQRDDNGLARQMIGTNWDITREKEAERQKLRARQLELKNKELEQFTYAVSHDLEEPLHSVRGFIDLLRNHLREELDEKATEYLDLITQASGRMQKLIRALLDYSRIGLYDQAARVDCNALLQELLDDLSAQIKETGATFKISDLPAVEGYETGLRILFQNLISNALKFHREGVLPEIEISARAAGENWEFCVADNGIGIAAKHHKRIFAIFQRLHPQDQYPGTGIGLSHCRKIVEMHGGRIWVDSSPGAGSRFCFTIQR